MTCIEPFVRIDRLTSMTSSVHIVHYRICLCLALEMFAQWSFKALPFDNLGPMVGSEHFSMTQPAHSLLHASLPFLDNTHSSMLYTIILLCGTYIHT